jgi:hypothetical protein
MDTYTHNLAITVVDIEGNININTLIEEIKTCICAEPVINEVEHNGELLSCIFYWKQIDIGYPYSTLMGDLFTKSFYDNDIILRKHLKILLANIDKQLHKKYPDMNWCIAFHLSKIICDEK